MDSTKLQSKSSWMATLAKAPLSLLEERVETLGQSPRYEFLRTPEIGLTMVRGRVGGTGQPFNLGEMTITRCIVHVYFDPDHESLAGFGYVAGRSPRHAELAAICDALLQHPDWHATVQTQVINPLQVAAQEKRSVEAAEVESTRVNFFTLVRGES